MENSVIVCEECGIEYYTETIVKGKSFRHIFPAIAKLETESAEARAEIERLRSRNKVLDTAIAEMTEEQAALCAEEQSIIELVATKYKLIEQMRGAIKAALQSADAEWENKNQGHDWANACETMRAALEAAERGE